MTDEMIAAFPRPAWRPSHPGEILREDVLPALGLSVSAAAEHLLVSRQMLHRILAEESAVSPEMAVRLGKLCGDGPRIWLAMQQAHDLWQAERDLAGVIETIPTLSAA
ncbi:HigA family addiction module antitoxin [Acidisoma sp. 7E03]